MIVLDTHAWIFWINDNLDQFSENGLQLLESTDTLGVSVISCWEVAMLVAKNRLHFAVSIETWIHKSLRYPGVKLLPLDPDIAILSTRLPGDFHGDPADRMIVATCMQHQSPLLSKDNRIQKWGHIPVVW